MKNLLSLTEWFIGHCTDHRKLSQHTLKAYRHDLALFRAFTGDVPESEIDRNTLQRWLAGMSTVRPRTIRRRLATVKSMFSALERHGKIASNPLASFRSEVKVGKGLPKTVARQTVRLLLRSARKLPVLTQKLELRRIQDIALQDRALAAGFNEAALT